MKKSEQISYELTPYVYLLTGMWATLTLESATKVFGVILVISALLIIAMRRSYRKLLSETVRRRLVLKNQ